MKQQQVIRWIGKPFIFIVSLFPLFLLIQEFLNDELSANPIDDITDATGTWTLRFIVITLGITPLKKIFGWNWIAQFRRMSGLFTFLYASLHFMTYIYLDQFFDWETIINDVSKRPFITAGFASFLMLIPLAMTSFKKAIQWMGGKRWKILHKLIYIIGLCGVLHYIWLVKADKQRPLTYGIIIILLLGIRTYYYVRSRQIKNALEI